jgi:hypothetical protein
MFEVSFQRRSGKGTSSVFSDNGTVNVFTEADFLSADTTEIPLGASTAQLSTNEPQPGCSSIRDGSATAGTLPAVPGTPPTTARMRSFQNLSPEDIYHYRKYLKNKNEYHAKERKLHSNLNIVSLKKS